MTLRVAAGLCGFYCFIAHLTLNDISTDLVDPPTFTSVHVGEFPKKSVDLIPKAYPDIKTVKYPGETMDHVMDTVATVAATRSDWAVAVDAHGYSMGFLEAVATTPSAGFKDDVVVRVTYHEEKGVFVDMRSRSRVGVGDLGANAKRIRGFLGDLDDALKTGNPHSERKV